MGRQTLAERRTRRRGGTTSRPATTCCRCARILGATAASDGCDSLDLEQELRPDEPGDPDEAAGGGSRGVDELVADATDRADLAHVDDVDRELEDVVPAGAAGGEGGADVAEDGAGLFLPAVAVGDLAGDLDERLDAGMRATWL